MYIINKETLFVNYEAENTIIVEKNGRYSFYGNVINKILDNSCMYYGSSYKGRLKGSKNLLNGKYKLPIIISEKSNILFFPIKEKNKNELIWINFNQIKEFYAKKSTVEITFLNGLKYNLNISFTIFNNQMFKCSRLWLIYLTRC